MKKIGKILSTLAICGTMGLASLGFAGCKDELTKTNIEDMYNKYVVFTQEQEIDALSYEEWLEEIKTIIKEDTKR